MVKSTWKHSGRGEQEEEVKSAALYWSDGLILEGTAASAWEPDCRSLLKEMPKQEQDSREGTLGKILSGSRSRKSNTWLHSPTRMSILFIGSLAYLLHGSWDYFVFFVADVTKDATLQHTWLLKQLAEYLGNAGVKPPRAKKRVGSEFSKSHFSRVEML